MEPGEKGEFPANPHRLANIGTFRAYIEVYLRTNPRVYQAMTLMVRTLEPTPRGSVDLTELFYRNHRLGGLWKHPGRYF